MSVLQEILVLYLKRIKDDTDARKRIKLPKGSFLQENVGGLRSTTYYCQPSKLVSQSLSLASLRELGSNLRDVARLPCSVLSLTVAYNTIQNNPSQVVVARQCRRPLLSSTFQNPDKRGGGCENHLSIGALGRRFDAGQRLDSDESDLSPFAAVLADITTVHGR